MNLRTKFLRAGLLSAALALLIISGAQAEPRLDVLEFPSVELKHNPLHDPVIRKVAVFLPAQYETNQSLPIVYYLPGYGNSSEKFIKDAKKWQAFTQQLAEEVAPVLFVVVDGRNRWGGSQYLNSPAQGNYADYVCDEIVERVEARYRICSGAPRRIIAGHSSGGFGALRLGMWRPRLFDGIVALSPDSDFQNSHLPLVTVPGVTNVALDKIESCMAANMKTPRPTDGDLVYALGLSAAYAPRGRSHPGQFEWLYDADGRFREKVWRRWMDNDPLTIVQRTPNAFRASQSVYLEGPNQDQYRANIGAAKIYEILRHRAARCTFYEPPGKHSDKVPARLQRGLAWIFKRPMRDIQ